MAEFSLLPPIVRLITSDTTIDVINNLIIADTSGGNITITIPDLTSYFRSPQMSQGFFFHFKKLSSSNTLTIQSSIGCLIDGATTYTLTEDEESVQLQFNGLNNFYSISTGKAPIGGGGTVTSVDATGGTGINVTGGPITTFGTFVITNTLPDQTVILSNGTGISVTGTYPNFTITNTSPSSGGTVTSVSGTANRITSSGGNTPIIDISASYIGQNSITTLGTVTTGQWNASTIPILYGGTGQTTYTDGQLLIGNTTGNTLAKSTLTAGTGINITNSSGSITITNTAPSTVTPAALTKTDDSNITATLTGTPSTALLQAVNIALGWTGQLSISRGGTNSGTALNNNRVMQSSGGAIVEASAITASKALVSDTNGIPVASSVTTTELNYLSGAVSNIQQQLNAISAGSKLYLFYNY